MRPQPVSIVMYHSVSEIPGPYSISPDSFGRQIRYIHANYRIIRLRDVPDLLVTDGDRTRHVVLTFDDGLADFLEGAFPVLAELGVPATVFVPTGFIGEWNAWDAAKYPGPRRAVMSAEQLRWLQDTGLIDIGSHTVDHVRMSALPPREMAKQALESKSTLEDLLGRPVTLFAYPYGGLDDFCDDSRRVLAGAGYRAAVTTHWGTWNSMDGVLQLRRVFFQEDDRAKTLRRKIDGWHDWRALKERAAHRLRKASRALARTWRSGH